MRIYPSYSDLPAEAKGAVIAIGNFDGVHPGHGAVLRRAGEVARAAAAPLGVVTFEPHPRRFFQPDTAPFRLTPALAKRRLIEETGAALYYELAFDAAMAALTAEAFIERVLLWGLGVRHVVVGAGFAFGKGRTGTVSVLEHVAGHKGVGVTVVAPVADADGVLSSSTRVRDCLKRGEPERAAALLGRAWTIEGTVLAGDQRGRQLGFPTANLDLDDYLRPAFGVYAVRAKAPGDGANAAWTGVANLGVRPTIGGAKALLEAHLFDFSGELYGHQLTVELLAFIRSERRFESLDALKAQIAADSAKARHLLAAGGPDP